MLSGIPAPQNFRPLTGCVQMSTGVLGQKHRHPSMTGHFFGADLLLCNTEWVDNLPIATQSARRAAAYLTTAEQKRLTEAQGVLMLTQSDLDVAEFRGEYAPIIARDRAKVHAALVAAYLGA